MISGQKLILLIKLQPFLGCFIFGWTIFSIGKYKNKPIHMSFKFDELSSIWLLLWSTQKTPSMITQTLEFY